MKKVEIYKDVLAKINEYEGVLGDLVNTYSLEQAIAKCEVEDIFNISLDGFKGNATGGWLTYGQSGAHSELKCMLMGDKHRRTIGCSDDGRQPVDEWLFVVGFTSGAYMLHKDYPTEVFSEFFNELKKWEPKYVDSANKSLYFEPSKAKQIFNEYFDIRDKYVKKADVYVKQKRIQDLKDELSKLEGC